MFRGLNVDDQFGNPNRKKKPGNTGRKELEKPLSLSGRNNKSQVHEINKWALGKQTGLKKPGKREVANP